MAWRILFSAWCCAIALFSTGCSSTITMVEWRESRSGPKELISIDEMLKKVFTDEAYEAIKDIEVVEGPCSKAYVSGSNFWGSLSAFVTGVGFGRKVIIDSDEFGGEDELTNGQMLIHEFIHHLDDMTRDGEADFISLDEFVEGYNSCYGHPQYHGVVGYVESRADNFWTNVFGIGEYAEHIAYAGELISRQGCPPKLAHAFRKILRKYN